MMDEVFAAIVHYKALHDGCAPTIREVGVMCGINSTSHVRYYLTRLETAGKIRIGHGCRSIEVVGGEWRLD